MTAARCLPDTVGTLRVEAAADDPALRMAVSDAVRQIPLRRPGRAGNAILVVRAIDARSADPRRDPGRFGADVRLRVERCWGSAPGPGPAAVGADAVVFRDLAELLAHLVRDLAVGQTGDRWWWATLRGTLAPDPRVAAVLGDRLEIVPHVVAELRRLGALATVLAAVDDAACEQLVARLAEVHAAPHLTAAVAAVRADRPIGRRDTAAILPVALVAAVADLATSAQRLFAAAALQLADDPAAARSAGFSASASWVVLRPSAPAPAPADDRPSSPAVPPPDVSEPAGPPQPSDPPSAFARPPGTAEARGRGDRGGSSEEAATSANPEVATPARAETGSVRAARDPIGADGRGAEAGSVRVAGDPIGVDGRGADGRAPDGAEIESGPAGAEPGRDADGIATDLGGVFFLVALVRELRLPERFEDDWSLASRLGWWGTIEVLARSLLPHEPAGAGDPVWEVLTELAGGRSVFDRARSIPVASKSAIHLDPAWATPGPVVELAPIDATLARSLRGPVRHWLETVRPVIATMLVERLGCAPVDLVGCLLVRRAVIVADRMHVDIHLPLSSASVAVRRAGFDRDPGWVPELARVVAFHFDDDGAVVGRST